MDQGHVTSNGTIPNYTIYSTSWDIIFVENNTLSSRWNVTFLENNTISSRWNITLLRTLNDNMFRRLAPVVTILVAIMAVGTFGNLLICYIFLRRLRTSSQNFLLLCLGVFDLLSSCVGVPSEIFDVRHYYLYESENTCKAMRFLTTFPSLASILVLLIIAADRYRKICKPLHHQICVSTARIVVVIIVVVSLLLSAPALYIYGHRTLPTPVPGENGFDCSIDDTFKDSLYPIIYEIAFISAFIVCTIALVFIYVRILVETRRHIKYMKTHAICGPALLDDTPTTTSSIIYDETIGENAMGGALQQGSIKSSLKSTFRKRFSTNVFGKRKIKYRIGQHLKDTLDRDMYSAKERSGVRGTPVVRDIPGAEMNSTITDTTKVLDNIEEKDSKYSFVLNINSSVNDETSTDNAILYQMIELEELGQEFSTSVTVSPVCLSNTCDTAKNFTNCKFDIEGDVGISEKTNHIGNVDRSIQCIDLHCQDSSLNGQSSDMSTPCSLRAVEERQDIKKLEPNFDHVINSTKDLQCDSNLVSAPNITNERNTTSERAIKREPNAASEFNAASEPNVAIEPNATSVPNVVAEPIATSTPNVASEPIAASKISTSNEPNTVSTPNASSGPATAGYKRIVLSTNYNNIYMELEQDSSTSYSNPKCSISPPSSHSDNIIPAYNQTLESSSTFTQLTPHTSNSEYENMLADSSYSHNVGIPQFEQQLHGKLDEAKQYENTPTTQTHKRHEDSTSHSKNESSSKCCFQNEHGDQNCADYKIVNINYSVTLRAPNVPSSRVSFATELNDFDSVGNDSQDINLSSDNETGENQSQKLQLKRRSTQSLLAAKSTRKALRTTRATIIAFVITLGFILSYLPHLILIMLRTLILNFEQQINDDFYLNLYNIFLRSYFANNIINIFVYGCMHLEFRTQISDVWTRIKHSKRGE